jgi:hypothetical protein
MSQSKKYDVRLSQEKDTWNAAIVRRASAKKTITTKTQTGFKTKTEAKQWAKDELALFTAKQSAQNKRRAEKRK